MACKEDNELKPWVASVVRDVTTNSRTDYCIEKLKDFTSFFGTQSRLWLQGKNGPTSLLEFLLLAETARCHEVTETQLNVELKVGTERLNIMLDDLHKRGLISKTTTSDGDQPIQYSLTELGKNKQKSFDVEFRNNIAKTLGSMSTSKQTCLVDAVNTIKTLLSSLEQPNLTYSIRSHQAGDMGWIVYRHGVLYFQEYGWNNQFEAHVAEITASFIRNYDPKLDRCFIAERNGEIIGCVFLVNANDGVAKLRLFLVEPSSRGLGIGAHLVDECIKFARQANYHKISLWTHTILHSALRIYKAAGFKPVQEESHAKYGPEVVAQTWELDLY